MAAPTTRGWRYYVPAVLIGFTAGFLVQVALEHWG